MNNITPNTQGNAPCSTEAAFVTKPLRTPRDDALTTADVRALYGILLGRSPESDAVAEGQSDLHKSLNSLVGSLCDSDEFRLRVKREAEGPVTREEVRALYQILLGRQPESEEVIETQRRRHNSTISLARSICDSDEAYSRANGQINVALTSAEVRALYKILLGQTPPDDDAVHAEHSSVISLARSLSHPDQVRLHIKDGVKDPLTPADVRAVYQIVLGRQPESDDSIADELRRQKTVISLACSLCGTDEFCARLQHDVSRILTRTDVQELYEIVLGRQPENDEIIEKQLKEHKTATALAHSLSQSEEFRLRIKSGADRLFDGYRTEEVDILRRHLSYSLPESGFVKDFVGTRMRVEFNTAVSALNGVVFDRIPVPGDFRVEAIEWIGVLRAIEDSGLHFVTVELGAGWGPWVVSSGHVARQSGKTVRMYAVEADPGKVPKIAQHMIDNGFDPKDHVIFGGIAGPSDGFAYFPIVDAAGNWSGEAVYDNPPKGDYHKLPSISLRTLMNEEKTVDLIHIDIQGAEFDVVQGSLDELSSKVKWMVIGTHSRSIEGKLIDLLLQSNWSLENEQPCRCSYSAGRSNIFIDGTQVWRNLDRTQHLVPEHPHPPLTPDRDDG